MTDHLTLLLACFSIIFSRLYKQNRGVLGQLTFAIFSIFEYVILFFP